MMNENKQIVIDMGSSRISVMATEVLESGEVRILSEESKKSNDIRYGVVEQHTEAAHTITRLVRLLQNSAHLPQVNSLCVSLNAKTMKQVPVRIHRARVPNRTVTNNLINGMLSECKSKFNQLDVDVLDIIPLYYDIDGRKTKSPIGQNADNITGFYNVIVGSIYIKQEIERAFERTMAFTPHPYSPLGIEALSTVLLEENERQNGCALINFGAMTTTLGIYKEGVLQQLMVVGLGGLNITKDIESLGISEDNAEKLKCLKGCALNSLVSYPIRIKIPSATGEDYLNIDTDFLATIIEARLTEILTPILHEIQAQFTELEGGIIITGGGAKLNNILDFLEEKTGLPVRYGDHSEWLSEDTDERFYDPVYSQAVGTAVLLNEYQKEHPEIKTEQTENKENKTDKKNQKVKFTEKITSGITNKILRLFEDDNYLK